jgi:hypothetical protein
MYLLAIHVTRNGVHNDDDVITFTTDSNYPDVVEITAKYKTPAKSAYVFTLPRGRCMHYASTLIGALVDDIEPFEHVQISSAMFPAVMYDVRDLSKDSIVESINEMLYLTFDPIVRCVPK